MARGKLFFVAGAAICTASVALAAAGLTPDSPDPWLWLSDIHGAKPLQWVAGQNEKTFAALKSDPEYQIDHDAILAVLNANDRIPEPELHNGVVRNFWQDKAHVRGLWRETTVADYATASPHWNVLLDVDKLDADEHRNWVFLGASCAPSGTRCLVRLSPGGGDASVVREYDPKKKAFIDGGFTLPVAKSSAAYLDDDTILFATDFGKGSLTTSGYPRIVKMWKRGTPLGAAKVVYEAGENDVSARPRVFQLPAGSVALVERQVSFFQTGYYYVTRDGVADRIDLPLDADVKGMTGDWLVFTLRKDWTTPEGQALKQGSLIAVSLSAFAMKIPPEFFVLYTPGPRDTIDEVSVGRDAIYAAIYHNVTGSIHRFKLGPPSRAGAKWNDTVLDLPQGGSTRVTATDDFGPEAYFEYESFLKPVTLYAYDGQGEPKEIKSEPARFEAAGLQTDQYEAASADGTQVPYFYIHPKDQKGPLPTILYAYGGFELSNMPFYWNDGHKPLDAGQTWLARGGAVAVANIRGGGEFGPKWHQAAMKANHQHAFDDFEAVAADLARRGLSTPRQIGSVGASNGGLLVSATMVQRPDLFGAVVCQRPLIDMLRYTHFGAGQSWVDEYGDPANPVDRAWILKYSPYELVKKGGHYPPVFFITETSDDRVTPVFARMMAAKMEAQGHDVLFYESAEGGHGPGVTNEGQATMWALSYVYFAQKLGPENNLASGGTHAPKR